jgi:hypothetical protein
MISLAAPAKSIKTDLRLTPIDVSFQLFLSFMPSGKSSISTLEGSVERRPAAVNRGGPIPVLAEFESVLVRYSS